MDGMPLVARGASPGESRPDMLVDELPLVTSGKSLSVFMYKLPRAARSI